MYKILVVDDDTDLRSCITSILSEQHYEVYEAKDGQEAITRIHSNHYDLVLLDVHMPKMNGIEVMREIKSYAPSLITIVMTAFSNIRDAVEVTKQGAIHYLEKPILTENLVYLVNKALRTKYRVRNFTFSAPEVKLPNKTEFIGQSLEMKRIFSVIDKLSKVDTAVLIRGESGTGKELVAQALHFKSARKDNRFVTINCSAIPENLIESEFFGYEKGAFTGAESRKMGKFQYSDGGTLFLDEIGDISPGMQAKLLRAIQEKKFTPVGSNREVEVNVRIVAATNRNLEEMIKKLEFREDLFYRLNVLPIQLPPLRDRKNDIDSLASYFIEKFNYQHQKKITHISSEAMAILKAHSWPGNIRELENVIEHAFVIETTSEITKGSLPETLYQDPFPKKNHLNFFSHSPAQTSFLASSNRFSLAFEKLDFQANKEEFERQFLINALKAFKGKINQTSIHANIPKKTLLRKLEKYGIQARDYI